MSGEDAKEFQAELATLPRGIKGSAGVSAKKIKTLTRLALQDKRAYKNVVYYVERFVAKVKPEFRLAVLYVIDSICRTSVSRRRKKKKKKKKKGFAALAWGIDEFPKCGCSGKACINW